MSTNSVLQQTLFYPSVDLESFKQAFASFNLLRLEVSSEPDPRSGLMGDFNVTHKTLTTTDYRGSIPSGYHIHRDKDNPKDLNDNPSVTVVEGFRKDANPNPLISNDLRSFSHRIGVMITDAALDVEAFGRSIPKLLLVEYVVNDYAGVGDLSTSRHVAIYALSRANFLTKDGLLQEAARGLNREKTFRWSYKLMADLTIYPYKWERLDDFSTATPQFRVESYMETDSVVIKLFEVHGPVGFLTENSFSEFARVEVSYDLATKQVACKRAAVDPEEDFGKLTPGYAKRFDKRAAEVLSRSHAMNGPGRYVGDFVYLARAQENARQMVQYGEAQLSYAQATLANAQAQMVVAIVQRLRNHIRKYPEVFDQLPEETKVSTKLILENFNNGLMSLSDARTTLLGMFPFLQSIGIKKRWLEHSLSILA